MDIDHHARLSDVGLHSGDSGPTHLFRRGLHENLVQRGRHRSTGYSGPGTEYVLVPTANIKSAARNSCTVTIQASKPYKYNSTTGAATAWVTVSSSCTLAYALTQYLKRGTTTRGSATESFLPGSLSEDSLITVSCITTGSNTWHHVANVSPNPSASITCY